MNNYELEKIINNKLNSKKIHDYIPNGLQIEGKNNIKKIITGVSICQKLIDIAIQKQAEAIIVHHGFFWKNESNRIIKNKKNRLKSILSHEINLYNWHLPLDIHDQLGNNVQIAKKLGINILGKITDLVLWGNFSHKIPVSTFIQKVNTIFNHEVMCFKNPDNNFIKNIAWCSGRGQKYIKYACNFSLDAFLTGEASEDTMHYSYENKIHFFSAGHYCTERFGIQKLGDWLNKNYNLNVEFIDIYNPI
ncbi:Nif3-like dinuclear metal center hexameric protein [Buchnera aphidicola]|uniref:Nif3-like dinuclear metal center hexameric protein n=1 Tax=Buchnera aphidicola TaxID=9 RepID=UPI0031B8808F